MILEECDNIEFETAFDDFINRREYDKAENALFSIIRISFRAGWLAAGGNPPKSQKVYELFRKALEEIPLEDCIETDIGIASH